MKLLASELFTVQELDTDNYALLLKRTFMASQLHFDKYTYLKHLTKWTVLVYYLSY